MIGGTLGTMRDTMGAGDRDLAVSGIGCVDPGVLGIVLDLLRCVGSL